MFLTTRFKGGFFNFMVDRLENIEVDKPKEECGVFGIYLDPFLANNKIVELALDSALDGQHRGEESAGICVSDGCGLWPPIKRMGLIKDLYNDYEKGEGSHGGIYGHIAIVHNRYSTTGSSNIENAAPFRFQGDFGVFAVAHNGNITNAAELKLRLKGKGIEFKSTTDSEVIGALIFDAPEDSWGEKITGALRQLEGSFSLVISTRDTLFATRDMHGIRPLSIGVFSLDGKRCFAVSSETSGFSKLPIEKMRDILPGELVEIKDGEMVATTFAQQTNEAFCGLEFAYLMRPDSRYEGVQIDTLRREFGRRLAIYYPVPSTVDLVTYIPESARPAAEGYAMQISRMQNRYVQSTTTMIKGRYGTLNGAVRGFINPNQSERRKVAKDNYRVFDSVEGLEIVVVDDSIIEATTTKGVVRTYKDSVGQFKNKGVSKVHLRIVFPPVISSCPFGVDIDDKRFLVAREFKQNVGEIVKYIGADSLAYLSVEQFSSGIDDTVGRKVGLCLGCVKGEYPVDKFQANKLIFESEVK